jgi:hypothetical protein
LLRVWGVKQGLPYVYNVDESANFVPSAVGYFFTDSYNPHYFVNPPAFSYLLHGVFALWFGAGWPFGAKSDVANAYATDPTQVFVVARVTAALLGTAAVGFIYLTGKRLYDRRVGLIAAALMAVAFLPVFYSHLALNDVPALLPLAISLYGSAGVLKRGRPIDYVVAGLGLGLAIATKYTAGIALPALLVAILYRLMTDRAATTRVVKLGLAAGGIALLAFVVANPHALLSYHEFRQGLRTQRNESDFGKLGLDYDSGIAYYLWTLTWGLGWVPAIAAAIGAGFAFAGDRWRGWFLVPGPLLLILFMGVQGRYFGRWLMPALPELAILAALAAVKLGELVGRSERSRAALICGFALLLVAQGLERSVHADRVLARDDTRNLVRDWMVRNIPAGSKVVVEPVVPDAWFTDPGTPPPISASGRRWVKLPIGRWIVNDRGQLRVGNDGRAVKTEDYERTLRPGLLHAYESAGYCWVVIGSTQYGRALTSPREVPQALEYYRELDRRGTVVHKQTPYKQGRGPVDFNFDWSFDYYPKAYRRPGPTIAVYRLHGGRCAAAAATGRQ